MHSRIKLKNFDMNVKITRNRQGEPHNVCYKINNSQKNTACYEDKIN